MGSYSLKGLQMTSLTLKTCILKFMLKKKKMTRAFSYGLAAKLNLILTISITGIVAFP